MRRWELAAVALVALTAVGCVTPTHEENAARRSTWPIDTPGPLASGGGPRQASWPSVEGDILRGTSPADLAKDRASVSQPLTEALAKP